MLVMKSSDLFSVPKEASDRCGGSSIAFGETCSPSKPVERGLVMSGRR
jgi:hypothetical protein